MSGNKTPSRVRRAYRFIEAHSDDHSISVMCRVLGVARAGYYAWLSGPVSKGSGTANPNFSVGRGTAAEADQLGKIWVGDGAKKTADGTGWISADGTRVYRAPTVKSSPYATTGVQANFETYSINPVTGQKIKVSNGHLDVTD